MAACAAQMKNMASASAKLAPIFVSQPTSAIAVVTMHASRPPTQHQAAMERSVPGGLSMDQGYLAPQTPGHAIRSVADLGP